MCVINFPSLQTSNPHVVACLFKLFLSRLPDPVIPYDLTEFIIAVYEESRGSEEKDADNPESLALITKALKQLPYLNAVVLRFLIQFLSQVAALSDVNKMSADNLAIVFAPNILKYPSIADEGNPSKIMAKLGVVTTMIQKYDDIFVEIGLQNPPTVTTEDRKSKSHISPRPPPSPTLPLRRVSSGVGSSSITPKKSRDISPGLKRNRKAPSPSTVSSSSRVVSPLNQSNDRIQIASPKMKRLDDPFLQKKESRDVPGLQKRPVSPKKERKESIVSPNRKGGSWLTKREVG
jgi:hypothetical protein